MEPIVVEPDAYRFQAEAVERCRPADRDEDLVAVDCRAIRELDGVGAGRGRFWSDPDRPDACPDVDAVTPQGGVERGRAARMVIGVDPVVRRYEHGWHAVAGEDLRHLDAGRPRAEHDEALG